MLHDEELQQLFTVVRTYLDSDGRKKRAMATAGAATAGACVVFRTNPPFQQIDVCEG